MGLSGRKVKQRIPQDPRNLSWADDAARFGSNYLSKFGWDSSKGLGAGGDGRTSHIKVSHKLDMLGIGAAHQKDPNGIAWKQNKDFENLLKRLNETVAVQTPVESEDEKDEYMGEDISVDETEKKKKRKHKGGEDGSERKKKKIKDAEIDQQTAVVQESMEVDVAVVAEVKKLAVPRHRAHRARAIAAKNISSKSAAHISEILGVAPTPTSLSTALSAEFQPGKLTSLTDTDGLEIEKITTSTKSLAEYFKEKLASKSGGSSTPTTPSSNSRAEEDDSYDTPRIGLGASRVRLQVHSETEIVDEATQRMGLSKFSSLMSSSFLASTSSFVVKDEAEELIVPASDVEPERKREKKEKGKGKKNAEEEGGDVEKVGKKERKRDKKDKGKAVEIDEESSGKAEKKKKKKDKEATGDEDIEKAAAGFGSDGANEPSAEQTVADEVGAESRKKEKRKSEATGAKTKSGEDGKESRKEKKKKRRTTK
ncbi:hypothetical protein GALMADRAFT_140787 [Galerina marginata CBS 339.88]|uniref:G-patch domain-containing protein n=1 Tax=Galerina marginata (strain CBS 339.88) TaxID=685588 RepID=A0A067T5P9_GALM3|nr:hypothetical protein GALMADRAFT_140787 [Galerina marginata CBS 339.88]